MEFSGFKVFHNKVLSPQHVRNSIDNVIVPYSTLVVPSSMRSVYWKFFGFPGDENEQIISRQKIICVLCKTQIAYNKNTTNLRMHLQSKHMSELQHVEEGRPLKRQCAKPIKKIKLEGAEVTPSMLFRDIKEEPYFMEASGEEDEDVLTIVPGVSIGSSPYQDSSTNIYLNKTVQDVPGSNNMEQLIADFTIHDLTNPDIVEGQGFMQFLVNLISPCSLPSQQMLSTEVIPKLYDQERTKLLNELSNHTGDMSLGIEEWTCSRNRNHLSICAYFTSSKNEIQCKMLTTIDIVPRLEVEQWELILNQVLEDFSITPDRVSAVVCCTEREPVLNAFCNQGYSTLIPCFDFTINECVSQCFQDKVIKEILEKLRDQITLLKSHPLTSSDMAAYGTSSELANYRLVLDDEAVWLSTLEMLENSLQWREVIVEQIAKTEIKDSIKEQLLLGDDEWQIVADLITALQPLQMTLLSLGEENIPFISLLRPMLWQVINNKLCVDSSDSETLRNLKEAISELLNFRYDRLASLLNVATVIDPRFKVLSYVTKEEKESAIKEVTDLLLDIQFEEKDDEETTRKSNMEMLLGVSCAKKCKQKSEDPCITEIASYQDTTTATLDVCPIKWWAKHRDSYPRIALLADKYLCVPAVATFPRKRTLQSLLSFHTKRSTLPEELLNEYLFLHVNCSMT